MSALEEREVRGPQAPSTEGEASVTASRSSSALATHPLLREYDALRGSRHPGARAARDQADWLSFLELDGFRPRTLLDYQSRTDRLLQAFPDKHLSEFTDGDIALVLRKLPQASRANYAATYRNWFRWARVTRRVHANPMDLLPRIRPVRSERVEIFPEAEEAALRSLPSPHGHLMTILFEAGLRRSEAIHLQARRCNLDQAILQIIDGAKGGKTRTVPISTQLAHAISDLLLLEGIRPADYLWHTRPGGGTVRRTRPMGNSSFDDWWGTQIKAASVPYRKPHTTRHTFATRWRQRGLSSDDIQFLLGHSSISTTVDIYLHTSVHDVTARMRELT